jgi:hypothetical protein
MYKLPKPEIFYNKEFLENFNQEECVQYDLQLPQLIKYWWDDENKFKIDSLGKYATSSCKLGKLYVTTLMCRLYGEKNPNHFKLEWVPIMHRVISGYNFNWGTILSDNLYRHIENFLKLKAEGQSPPFYMSAYIMDAIFFHTYFPQMGWQWTPSSAEPIHIYHSKLWEENAKEHFYEICHHVIIPLHQAFFSFLPPRITEQAMHNLDQIGDWYIEETFSYIRVYGCNAPPHALPKFMPDRLVCREIAYQTTVQA